MIYLLDVNILIAMIDPAHVAHDIAHAWFGADGYFGWATCPLTENSASGSAPLTGPDPGFMAQRA